MMSFDQSCDERADRWSRKEVPLENVLCWPTARWQNQRFGAAQTSDGRTRKLVAPDLPVMQAVGRTVM
jgi:hypothetical protein